MSEFRTLRLEVLAEGTQVLRLTRPEIGNSVNGEMIGELEAAWRRVAAVDPPAVVLTGSGGRTFCSGGDLGYFATLQGAEAVRAMSTRMQALLQQIHDADFPVIAAVDGNAYGGGCEILTACHLRLATAGSRFRFLHATKGLVTGWGGGRRLVRLVGPSMAAWLLLTAEALTAEDARDCGLIHRVVAQGTAYDAAVELAARLAGHGREAMRSFLEIVRQGTHDVESVQARRETELFVRSWTQADI